MGLMVKGHRVQTARGEATYVGPAAEIRIAGVHKFRLDSGEIRYLTRDQFWSEAMTLGEARDVLVDAIEEVQTQGFRVQGWDDGRVYIIEKRDGTETWIDPEKPNERPKA